MIVDCLCHLEGDSTMPHRGIVQPPHVLFIGRGITSSSCLSLYNESPSRPIISIYCPPSSSCIDLIDIFTIKMSPSPGAVFLLSHSASICCGSIYHSSCVSKRAWRSRIHPSTFLRPASRCWVTSHPPPTNSDNDCALSSLFGVDPPGE